MTKGLSVDLLCKCQVFVIDQSCKVIIIIIRIPCGETKQNKDEHQIKSHKGDQSLASAAEKRSPPASKFRSADENEQRNKTDRGCLGHLGSSGPRSTSMQFEGPP